MSKRGLPTTLAMRHDSHYVEELTQTGRSIGRMISTSLIEPNPAQPRVEIGDLRELISSIKEKGILEPLLVKPLIRNRQWLLIAGERRWRAAVEIGLREVPCVEMEIDDNEVAEIALIENLQRKDLNIWEEADGLFALTKKFGYTHEQIAEKISKSRSTVTEMFSIATIPVDIRHLCTEKNILSKFHLLAVARQFNEAAMLEYIRNLSAEVLAKSAKSESAVSSKEKIEAKKSEVPLIENNNHFPLKRFIYQQPEFKIELKFKKPVNTDQLKQTLLNILSALDD